jgi:hypothetical protein
MPTPISGEEFTRWMNEQANFRTRLETRMGEQNKTVIDGLSRIEAHLAEINGRTRKNSEAIAAIDIRLSQIEEEATVAEATIRDIRDKGCSQYAAHLQVLRDPLLPVLVEQWSAKKKAAIGSGLIATGTLLWPLLQQIVKDTHTVLNWFATR